MSIADVYDALSSQRSYKDAMSHEESLKIITDESAISFDPVLVKVLMKIQDSFKEYHSKAHQKVNE